MINSKRQLAGRRWAVPTQGSAIFFLNAFDTAFVQMDRGVTGKLARGAEMNNIQIEKLDLYDVISLTYQWNF